MLPDPRPYFANLVDPRRETKNKLHSLHDILMIVLCAVLSGVDDWVGMECFAEEKEAWFRQFLSLNNGIPSHDTLSDVMGRIQYEAFAQAFLAWSQTALPSLAGEQIAIDGKTLRGSRQLGQDTVHLVSAFAARAKLVLVQPSESEKSNEIKAIPTMLAALELEGATVTIDAMGCQKDIAAQIILQKADYVLALKDNHRTLADDATLWMNTEYDAGRMTVHETIEKDHGRIETRRYVLSEQLGWLTQKPEWSGLHTLGMVESTRDINGKSSCDRRYFICSFNDLPRFANAVRQHWSIENQQHWLLDVQFNEDANRSRKDHSAKNLATIRRMALNLIRHNAPNSKRSLRSRQLSAALNDDYRFNLIFANKNT